MAAETFPSRGFSPNDLTLLAQIQARLTRQGTWGRARLVQDSVADFLAIWEAGADDDDSPVFAIARFKGTGTYALTRGEYLVATGRSLRDVVAAFDRGTAAPTAAEGQTA